MLPIIASISYRHFSFQGQEFNLTKQPFKKYSDGPALTVDNSNMS